MATNENFDLDLQDEDAEDFVVDFGEVTDTGGGGTSNFNDLSNRPKYDGQLMTGETNIPKVPSKTSELTNDSDYQTGAEVDSAISTAVEAEATARENADNDLQEQINDKQDTLTAGENITIENNVISASGGSITPVQTTGTSTTDVMSQNATTSMIYADPGTAEKIRIGSSLPVGSNSMAVGEASGAGNSYATAVGNYSRANRVGSLALGYGAEVSGNYGIGLGYGARPNNPYSVAFAWGSTTDQGQVQFGLIPSQATNGYNGSAYRLLSGVYDPVDAHDAATKGYVDGKVLSGAGAPTTSTIGTVGQLYEDTTNGKLYQCTSVSGGTYTWEEVGAGGGGSITPVQTTGTSTTDVMSQDATTKMIYPDIASNPYKMVIGDGSIGGTNKGVAINGAIYSGLNSGSIAIGAPDGSYAQIGQNGRANSSVAIGSAAAVGRGYNSVSIGASSYCNSGQDAGENVAIGYNSYAGNGNVTGTVSLGARSKPTRQGEVNVGNTANQGYNNTAYRVIGGVHDGQDAHDVVTVEQLNATIDAINTATGSSIPHVGA